MTNPTEITITISGPTGSGKTQLGQFIWDALAGKGIPTRHFVEGCEIARPLYSVSAVSWPEVRIVEVQS